MNPTLELDFWTRLLGILALEIAAVITLGFLAQTLAKSAFWRRAFWQSCFVSLFLLVASEFSGVGRGVAVWCAGKPSMERKVSVRILPADEQFIPARIENEIPPPIEFSEKPAPIAHAVWWPGILWLAGFALIIARILFARILFLTLRWRKTEITDATLLHRVSELAQRLGIQRKIYLLESPGFSSPMTFGIAQSCIALPKNFAQNFNSAEQDAMLTHELAHVSAHDPFWYLLADVASALLWWHPLVWLARRRLHSASELAADEAAAILENGPGTLAECLVNLGQRMTQSRSFGWLGVDGNGFRSHLGQRVERLLNLKTAEKNKLRGWPLILAKTAGTVFFGGLIVFTSGWIQNGKVPREKDFSTAVQKSWNGSFASMTLAALTAEPKESAANERRTTSKVATVPRYDEVTFDTLIYDNISDEQFKSFVETAFPASPSFGNFTAPSNSVAKIWSALSTVMNRRIAPSDSVGSKFNGMRLTYQGNPTNFENTCEYSTETKNGIRIVTAVEMKYKTTTPWSFSLVPQKRDGAIQINLAWKDGGREIARELKMPEGGVAIVRRNFSGDPLRNQLIVFSSAGLLYTRTFQLNPRVVAEQLGLDLPTEFTSRNFDDVARSIFQKQLNQKVRSYFEGAKVRFDAPGNTTGKAVFFNARTGMLMVRATTADLEKIQNAIELRLLAPSQVVIEAKFVEIGEAAMKKLGLNWFTQNAMALLTNQTASEIFLSGTNVMKTNIVSAEIRGEPLPAIAGIFTDAQYQVVLKTLEKAGGTDILSAPKVTTLSGRQTQISVLDAHAIVNGPGLPPSANTNIISTNGLWLENIFTGPVLDVFPTVSADGFSIQMSLKGMVSEFLGYYDAAHKKFEETPSAASLSPEPQVRLRSLKRDVNVWDGQTVMLALEDQNHIASKRKNLFVFVTATIIDPAGNRVHEEEDMPFATNSVPKQP